MPHPAIRLACRVLPALLLAACATAPAPRDTTLVLRAVRVVDTEAGREAPPQDVFIAGDRIAAIAPAGRLKAPATASVVEGDGRWLMPGLWDMHAHWYDEATLPVFLAHGVTGLRQMRGYTGQYATRAKGLEGSLQAPRVHLASPLVDGPNPASEPALKVADAEAAREVVRLVARSRADFLKVYDQIPADAYRALRDEARRLGVRVEGHVPIALDWAEASAGGTQRSFEHLHSLMVWTARDAEALHARWLAYHEGLGYNDGIGAAKREESAAIHHAGYDHFDPARFADIAATLKQNDTWQTPTCVLWRARRGRLDADAPPDPRDRLIPAWMRDFWQGWWPKDDPEAVAKDFAVNARRDAFCLARTRDLYEAGVPLLAGSDTVMPFVYPGSSLHEELALMVEAGLPPLAALQTATRNPARFLGHDDLGVVRPGALADLVLLGGDPLADIGNVRLVEGVAIGGAWMDAAARQAALDRVERIQAAPSVAERMALAYGEGGLDAAFGAYDALCPAPPEQADCGLFNAYWALVPQVPADQAAPLLAWLEEHGADDAELLSQLARHAFDAGDKASARRLVALALSLAPGDPMLMQQQESLAD